MLVVFLSWFIKMKKKTTTKWNEWLTTTEKYISIDRFMPLVYILRFDIYQIGMIIRFFSSRAVCFGCRNRWINICRVFNGKYQFGAEMEAAKKPNTSSTNAFDLWLSAHFRADLMSFFSFIRTTYFQKCQYFVDFDRFPLPVIFYIVQFCGGSIGVHSGSLVIIQNPGIASDQNGQHLLPRTISKVKWNFLC